METKTDITEHFIYVREPEEGGIIPATTGVMGLHFNEPLGFVEGESGTQVIFAAINKLADKLGGIIKQLNEKEFTD